MGRETQPEYVFLFGADRPLGRAAFVAAERRIRPLFGAPQQGIALKIFLDKSQRRAGILQQRRLLTPCKATLGRAFLTSFGPN